MTEASEPGLPARFFVETLGCPKNAVDSDKVVASLLADGLTPADSVEHADLVVLNTCAFVDAARRESIDTALALADTRKPGAKLVLTGCLAERHGDELAAALPEVDAVIGFAGEGTIAPVVLGAPRRRPTGVRDLLELPRPTPGAPWAYLKVAEGCDRACAFCAIPSFRGKQRSRRPDAIVAEAQALLAGGVAELVLVAQDPAWYGRDAGEPGALVPLLRRLEGLAVDGLRRVRLLYLYPREVRGALLDVMLDSPVVVPYFDLSLQHASRSVIARMRRWGSAAQFKALIDGIRARRLDAAFRSSFMVGFPGETEADHAELLSFLDDAALDWAGFFPFSSEDGTAAASMDGAIAEDLVAERLRECSDVQDRLTRAARDAFVGQRAEVLVESIDGGGGMAVGRTHREAPEIDGVVHVRNARMPTQPGALLDVTITESLGTDVVGVAVAA